MSRTPSPDSLLGDVLMNIADIDADLCFDDQRILLGTTSRIFSPRAMTLPTENMPESDHLPIR
jgi:hypothetical protein